MIARKRFGQHFLVDESVLDAIMDSVDVKHGDSVVEIGPGTGTLTKALLEKNVVVTAIEIDRDFVKLLGSSFEQIELIESDVLQVPATTFRGKRILGNLPYNISTPLLLKMCDVENVVDMHFMVQKEVAERLTADVGTKVWGRLSVKIRYTFKVSSLFDVEPKCFSPVPQVMSSFVRFEPFKRALEAANLRIFDDIIRVAFSQRRKKVSNSLKAFDIDWDAQTVDAASRADQLGVSDYVELANSVS